MNELKSTMRAVFAPRPGGPEALEIHVIETPSPGPGEVLVDIAYAGVNRPDLIQREGRYAPPPGAPQSLGLEVAGRVAALGADAAADWTVGQEVCALLPGGGYADYALAAAGPVLPLPAGAGPKEAAGLVETSFTVWPNVFERGALAPGETLLVHGGASGIGTTAIQMAAARGATVLATAGSPDKADLCRRLGAARAINYREVDFVEAVKEAGGADVILDMVGGDYVARNLEVLKVDGRLVQIAFLKGPKVEINLAPLMVKRQTLTGSTLRPRPLPEKARLARAVREHVWPLVADGRLAPVIDSVFALEDVADAHRRLDSGSHAGKVLLATGH
ncbi:MAG: NAD(P)H-quinone oxidoreductase [Caulobacterales bacterium]|nr:NAD(P)H-quinone oxidoreductase [Caulobacterales bacterium]